ncbi:MAG: alpha/beta hydrolase [Pseudomonadota bacterium]
MVDDDTDNVIHLGYTATPGGQIHWRRCGGGSDAPDLFLLHPAPFTSMAYERLMPLVAGSRRVWAPDYPGCGGSFAIHDEPSIAMYADAIAAMAAAETTGPIDVLGFHSGCLVAIAMAQQAGISVRRLILVDVPAFEPAKRDELRASLSFPADLSADPESIGGLWSMAVAKRAETDGLDAAVRLFADSLRHADRWPGTFVAAFSYAVEAACAGVEKPTTIIATDSSLLEPSRRAASLIPAAELIELLAIKRSVLHGAAPELAPVVTAALA